MYATITTTENGKFRAETRFQRLGTFKSKEKAEAAIELERQRLEFIQARVADDDDGTYNGGMRARMDAEQAWANR